MKYQDDTPPFEFDEYAPLVILTQLDYQLLDVYTLHVRSLEYSFSKYKSKDSNKIYYTFGSRVPSSEIPIPLNNRIISPRNAEKWAYKNMSFSMYKAWFTMSKKQPSNENIVALEAKNR